MLLISGLFPLPVPGCFLCMCTYVYTPRPRPPRPLLRVYKSLRACVHVTMINESGKAPVGRDQVQQDLT